MIEQPNNNRIVILSRIEDDAEVTFAKFVAELVRQGVNFHATIESNDYVIRFNGGH